MAGLTAFGSRVAAAQTPNVPLPLTWTADNGNGTYSNPLFYDEFSDPDLIRVGDDYYLTGTTMHAMPGLPILHSRDLVNWEFLTYALDKLDLGPAFRLQGGEIYGQGIWAPCLRYHDGTFYIFSNVNHHHTQVFRARNPAGPWTRSELGSSLHDLSVLFDDDGKIYVVWGYNDINFAELKPDLSDIKPETHRVIIPHGSGMGEGSHFYRIGGKYYIFSAQYDPICYMACARADRPEGPYEVTVVSTGESLGFGTGWRLKGMGNAPGIDLIPPHWDATGSLGMHQGGIVQTQTGEWWGFSMMDHNAIGRLTCLSPVTWQNGWPYFGLPGNLTRSPRTWIKPNTGHSSPPSAPYVRNDDFAGPRLQPVWQWNHVPDDSAWSLTERPGRLRLHALPAPDFWLARNSLTQRAIGPESVATVQLDTAGMRPGDVAGLALLNKPYAWIGVRRTEGGAEIALFNQITGKTITAPLGTSTVHLRVQCDFDPEEGRFSFSADGTTYQSIGDTFPLVFQLKTFQGVRYALFSFNQQNSSGGYADFAHFTVDEPRPRALTRPIPTRRVITLTNVADGATLVEWNGFVRAMAASATDARITSRRFRVLDRGNGRVALEPEDGSGFVAVTGVGADGAVRVVPEDEGDRSTFQWEEMQRGDVMLMSLLTHRYLQVAPQSGGLLSAEARGATPDHKDGACFSWQEE